LRRARITDQRQRQRSDHRLVLYWCP
jgi:hypothetical protein